MRNIVLICAAGMSTSLLVTKMRKAAEEEAYECTINAYSVADVAKVGKDADIILLGPQIRFQLDKVKAQVSCPVEPIEMRAYGQMDGEAVLEQVMEVLDD